MADPSTHPLWFGATGRPRFGQLHLPPGGEARAGVVICPPLGYEYTCSHRTLRCLAEALAARGCAALRFDYDGIGDSAGSITDPDRLTAWTQSVIDAIDFFSVSGIPIAAVGMRFGATLALEVTRYRTLRTLVLWDPVPSGRAWVRELRTFASVSAAGGEVAAVEAGGLDASTLKLDEVTLQALEAFAPDGSAHHGNTLVLARPDRSTKRLQKLVGESECVTWWGAEGQGALLDGDSLEARVPERSLAALVEWLPGQFPPERVPVAVPEASAARFESHGGEITERIVAVGPHGLFGILTECNPVAGRPLLVCLNNSVDHHIGPGRLWVDCGRSVAEHGFPVLRLDLTGLGDSPAQPGQAVDRPYPVQAVEDVEAATELGGHDGAVLVGVCSGARIAIEAADQTGPRGVIAINPPLGIPLEILHQASPDLPNPPAIVRSNRDHRLRRRLKALLPQGIWRLRTELGRGPESPRQLGRLLGSGADVLLLYGDDDFGLWKARQTLAWMFRRFAREPNFTLITLPRLDHGLIGTDGRAAVSASVTQHLLARFATRSDVDDGGRRPTVQADSARRQ